MTRSTRRPGRAWISPFRWPGRPPASLPSATSAPARSPSTARPSPAWPGTPVQTHPLAQLGPADLQAFMDTWYAGAAAATWNLNLAALRSFYALRPPPAPGRR